MPVLFSHHLAIVKLMDSPTGSPTGTTPPNSRMGIGMGRRRRSGLRRAADLTLLRACWCPDRESNRPHLLGLCRQSATVSRPQRPGLDIGFKSGVNRFAGRHERAVEASSIFTNQDARAPARTEPAVNVAFAAAYLPNAVSQRSGHRSRRAASCGGRFAVIVVGRLTGEPFGSK